MGLESRYLSTLLRQVCGSNCKQNGGMRRGEEPTHFDNTSSRAASSPRLEYSLHNALGRPVTRNTGSTSGRTMAPDFSRSAWRSIVFSVRTNRFASMVSTTYERTMRRAVLHSDNRNERGEKRLRTVRTAGVLDSPRTRLHLRGNSSSMSCAARPRIKESSAVGGAERVVGARNGE